MYSQKTTVHNVAVSSLSGCVVDRAVVDTAWRVLQQQAVPSEPGPLCSRVTQHSQTLLRAAPSCSFHSGLSFIQCMFRNLSMLAHLLTLFVSGVVAYCLRNWGFSRIHAHAGAWEVEVGSREQAG